MTYKPNMSSTAQFKKHPSQSKNSKKTNESLDHILGNIGYAQNRSKHESVPVFMGAHTKYICRHYVAAAKCFGLGRVGTDGRYLGAKISAPKQN